MIKSNVKNFIIVSKENGGRLVKWAENMNAKSFYEIVKHLNTYNTKDFYIIDRSNDLVYDFNKIAVALEV